MKMARVTDGVVVNLMTGVDPSELPPYMLEIWQECPEEVEIGWTFDGTTWAAPLPPPPPTIWEMMSDLSLYEAEQHNARRERIVNAITTAHGVPADIPAFRAILAGMDWPGDFE